MLETQCVIKSCVVRIPRPNCNQGHVHLPALLLHLRGPCPGNSMLTAPTLLFRLSSPMKLHTHSPYPTSTAPWHCTLAAPAYWCSLASASPQSSTLIAPSPQSSSASATTTVLLHLSALRSCILTAPNPLLPLASTIPALWCASASATPESSMLTAPPPCKAPQLPRSALPHGESWTGPLVI